jgi:tRNA G37 N-methylase TrmD
MDSFNPALDGLLDCGHYTRPKIGMTKLSPPFCCQDAMQTLQSGDASKV